MGRPKTTQESFWKKVDQSGGPDACWPWMQAVSTDGFGKARLNYKCIPSHRLAYFYATGEMPERRLFHTCENHACCNPKHLKLGPADEDRFWSFVDKNGPVASHIEGISPCWIWTGGKRKNGHGHWWIGGSKSLPHRYSYEIHSGPIPDGHNVLHKCDNGACVNPDHLFTGTQLENMRDAAAKGRSVRGTRQPQAVLDDDKVRRIRELAIGGMSHQAIADNFGVARTTITPILNGRTWKHVK